MQLNYLPFVLLDRIAPNDSRYRPDIRALENGDMKLAASEKHRLEENQRARRRIAEEKNESYTPRYFEHKEAPGTGEMIWSFNGQYWKDRSNKDWSTLKIYEDDA